MADLKTSPPPTSSSRETAPGTPPVDLKTPWLAALLTWALPGAGQIYQGRYFKGVLFCLCILGMFCFGVKMGEGRPVYLNYFIESEGQLMKKRNYGYLSQFLVGAAAWPALIQSGRYESAANDWQIQGSLDAPFRGAARGGRDDRPRQRITGRLALSLQPGPLGAELRGRLVGTLDESGEPVDLELAAYPPQLGIPPLGLAIAANPERPVLMQIQKVVEGPENLGENLQGAIPRPWRNWFQVPLNDDELQDLNARLGKRWELAMVLTWIAGLLNILAIWDAFEGPAYGVRPAPPRPKES